MTALAIFYEYIEISEMAGRYNEPDLCVPPGPARISQ
jgi:hypothetical protein